MAHSSRTPEWQVTKSLPKIRNLKVWINDRKAVLTPELYTAYARKGAGNVARKSCGCVSPRTNDGRFTCNLPIGHGGTHVHQDTFGILNGKIVSRVKAVWFDD